MSSSSKEELPHSIRLGELTLSMDTASINADRSKRRGSAETAVFVFSFVGECQPKGGDVHWYYAPLDGYDRKKIRVEESVVAASVLQQYRSAHGASDADDGDAAGHDGDFANINRTSCSSSPPIYLRLAPGSTTFRQYILPAVTRASSPDPAPPDHAEDLSRFGTDGAEPGDDTAAAGDPRVEESILNEVRSIMRRTSASAAPAPPLRNSPPLSAASTSDGAVSQTPPGPPHLNSTAAPSEATSSSAAALRAPPPTRPVTRPTRPTRGSVGPEHQPHATTSTPKMLSVSPWGLSQGHAVAVAPPASASTSNTNSLGPGAGCDTPHRSFYGDGDKQTPATATAAAAGSFHTRLTPMPPSARPSSASLHRTPRTPLSRAPSQRSSFRDGSFAGASALSATVGAAGVATAAPSANSRVSSAAPEEARPETAPRPTKPSRRLAA